MSGESDAATLEQEDCFLLLDELLGQDTTADARADDDLQSVS